jgi:hypothetical protein
VELAREVGGDGWELAGGEAAQAGGEIGEGRMETVQLREGFIGAGIEGFTTEAGAGAGQLPHTPSGIVLELLDAERNALRILVDIADQRFDFVALLQHLAEVIDLAVQLMSETCTMPSIPSSSSTKAP